MGNDSSAALREAISAASPPLDEGFVGTVKAYMKKSDDDGLAGMVDVLRILLLTRLANRAAARTRARRGSNELALSHGRAAQRGDTRPQRRLLATEF